MKVSCYISIRVSKTAVYAMKRQSDDGFRFFVTQLDEHGVARVIKVIDHAEVWETGSHTRAGKKQV